MAEQRRIERHQLPYYLKVFNRITDKPLGFIGNLSENGLMLLRPYPMMVDAVFSMRLKIPGQESRLHCIDFQARCMWSREDVTPGSFDSGFAMVSPPPDIADMCTALQHYFSFQPKIVNGAGGRSESSQVGR
jgi:hypothetical protein